MLELLFIKSVLLDLVCTKRPQFAFYNEYDVMTDCDTCDENLQTMYHLRLTVYSLFPRVKYL